MKLQENSSSGNANLLEIRDLAVTPGGNTILNQVNLGAGHSVIR